MGTESHSTNPFFVDPFQSGTKESIFNLLAVPNTADAVSVASSNPFLSAIADTEVPTNVNQYSNPFAQFLRSDTAPSSSDLSFNSPALSHTRQNSNDLSDLLFDISQEAVGSRRSSTGNDSDSAKRSPPRRPPPPRVPPAIPIAPAGPPQQTKDLILSVTGALEATSTDLLDRLQATRTPSPTPLRDLDSPSPTDMMEVNDLLSNDDIQVPRGVHIGYHTTYPDMQQEAINIFEAIANLSREQDNKGEHIAIVPAPPAPTPALIPSPTSSPVQQITCRPPPPPPPPSLILVQDNKSFSCKSSFEFDTGPSQRSPVPSVQVPQARTLDDVRDVPANYVAMRKASHDITGTRQQTIPIIRKKFSLDYSSSMLEPSATMEQLEPYTNIQVSNKSLTSGSPFNHSTIPGKISDNESIDSGSQFNHIAVLEKVPEVSDIENRNGMMAAGEVCPAKLEPRLIFQKVVEKPAVAEADSSNHVSTPDRFSVATFSGGEAPSDMFVADMNQSKDEFDAFEERFESIGGWDTRMTITSEAFDPFGDSEGLAPGAPSVAGFFEDGFGTAAAFNEFLNMSQPRANFHDEGSAGITQYSTADQWPQVGINNYQDNNDPEWGAFPRKSAHLARPTAFGDTFGTAAKLSKTDSAETTATPLFDEDVSQPLEPFPRENYIASGWEMQIRYPIKKKFTGQRFWKKVFVRLVYQGGMPHLEILNQEEKKEAVLHEWSLQPCYAISDIGAQQYDQFGKIFTVKIQFIIYKERPGVRPGQVTKAERLTNKLSQFAAYAIQGDYQGVKEFGSDLKKLGLPVEHWPQISLICKLGSHNYEDMKQFSSCVEDGLFRLSVHRDNVHIKYKMEEVQITAVDETYIEQNSGGSVLKQMARVRLFFLGFLSGMPDVEIGVNDLRRQGKEVVGRHDIIPVVTEEWIRLENIEFHSCIQQDTYEETKTIKFKPPDQCYLELMRFRVRPPKNRELPLQVKTVFRICGNNVDIYSDILVPGFTSRKLGLIPCEDVSVRIPIPECWIYLFRTEKHFRYGSVKSAHRRTGKVKGIERLLGAIDTLEQHLIEVTSGQAKYEHHHRSIVWRMACLPKEGQGAYTAHNLVCHLTLTSYDQVPEELTKHCFVEFTMPITQVSHMTVRSVSICNSDSDDPPEKYVRHLARHEYKIEIEKTYAENTNDYLAVTMTKKLEMESQQPWTKKPLGSAPDSEDYSD